MYEGAWLEGRAKGNGVKVLPNGTMFEGDWDDHVFIKGKCQFSDGQIYDGEWKNGKPEGFGLKFWPDGRRYEGQWILGKPVGEGIKTYADGTSKRGTWTDGIFTAEEDVEEGELTKNEESSKPIDL